MRRLVVAIALAGLACSHKTPFRFPSDLDTHEKFHYDLDLESFKLSNGLTVVLAPARDTNLVVVDVRYQVGSADDPKGKTGLAHFLEHLTFFERKDKASPSLWDRLAGTTLWYNAFTSADATDYVETSLASRWSELLEVEASRMAGTCEQIDDASLERERAVVLAEIAQRGISGFEPLLETIFGEDAPYAHVPGGHDVPRITRADVCAFLADHYAPDHAILVVSGAVDRRVMRTAIIARFGAIAAHGTRVIPDVVPFEPGPADGPRTLASNGEQPYVVLAYPSPAWGTNEATYHELAELLVQAAMNRVAREAEDIDDVTVFDVGGGRAGATLVAARAPKGADLAHVEQELRAGLPNALGHSATDEFVIGTWRAYLYAEVIGRYEDLGTRGGMIADYLQLTDRTDFQIHDLEVIHALTAPTLLAYTDHYLVHATPMVIRIVPKRQRDGAHEAKLTSLRTRVVKDLPTSRMPVDLAEADVALTAPPVPRSQVPDEITLDNGLRVVFAQRPGSALFEARMVFPTGSADDPPDAPGTARLAAEKLEPDYKRTFDWAQWDLVLAGTGVGTSYDEAVTESSTVISTSGIGAWAQWHLWHLHLKLEAGIYDPEDLAGSDVADDDDDERKDTRTIMARLYGADHPYVRRGRHRAPDADALAAFRRNHYVTVGATLIIAGDFDRAKIEHDVRELWGAWPRRAPADVHQVPAAMPEAGPSVFVREDPDADQIHLGVMTLARSTFATAAPARLVANELVNLRLAAIRDELAASYGVSARYRTTAAGDLLTIDGELDPARAGDAIARIEQELATLYGDAASLRADFVRARRAAMAAAMATSNSAAGAADAAQTLVTQGLPLDYLLELPAKVGAVTPAEIATLLHGDLDPARMVVLVRGPGAKAAVTAAGLAHVTELAPAKTK
jgi:zinc protease